MGAIGREVAEGVAGGQMSPAGIWFYINYLIFIDIYFIDF